MYRFPSHKILSLHHQALTEIPKDKILDKEVEGVDLSYNKIETLNRLAFFTKIKYLNLAINRIESLPQSLEALRQLEYLNLSGNPLGVFPKVILTFKHLKVLKLKHCQLESIPEEINQLSQLQHLDVSFNPIIELPQELAELPKLKQLNLEGHRLQQFPMVLVQLPQLQAIDKLDLSYRLGLDEAKVVLFFKVLRQLHKHKVDATTLEAAAQLFLLEYYEGELAPIFPLLRINYTDFAQVVRQYLFQQTNQPLGEKSEVAVLGEANWLDEWLVTQQLQPTITATTTHIVLGDKITKKEVMQLQEEMAFVSEKNVLAFFRPTQTADWLEEHREQLAELLLSGQEENLALALQLANNNEILNDFLTELLWAYTHIQTGNKTLRNEVEKVFYRHIPDFDNIVLPHASFQFYSAHKSEHAIYQGIKNITQQTPKWSGLRLAHLLYQKYQAGYIYILDHSSPQAVKEWLATFVEGETICFSSLPKMRQLPEAIAHYKHTQKLDLRGCNFRKFPDLDLLEKLPQLTEIDLRQNPIYFIPKGIYRRVAKYKLLLTK